MGYFSLTNISVTLITLYIARRIYWELTTGSRHRALIKQHGCLPAPPRRSKGYPLGLDFLFSQLKDYNEHRLLEKWRNALLEQDAHTIHWKILNIQVFLTDDPENIKTLLATDFDTWSLGQERINMMTSFLGHGIFTNEGPAWKHSREMLRPCFERSQVADMSLFEKHVDRLIDVLPADGETVDLQPLLHELTLDIASEFLFNHSTDALLDREGKDELRRGFVESFDYCSSPFESDNKKYGILGVLFLPDRKFKRCADKIQAFAQNIVEREMASRASSPNDDSTSKRYSFLDELLAATQDLTTIRSELLNILLAGRDTTASLLSNTLWELSRSPTVLARLRREITEHVGSDTPPTYAQLKEMKYLRAILNESQRMYPIVPSNSREALKDTILPRGGGPHGTSPVFIPKGAYVTYHPYSMHRRHDIYGADADESNPSRWMADETDGPPLRPGWGYIPFSGGPRVCIGQNFALTETMFVVVRLLQMFEIESRDDKPWAEKLTITCVGLNGCKVGLRPRGVA